MRIVVVGATGNVGTSVLEALTGDPEVDSITGIARRRPDFDPPKVQWEQADVTSDELDPLFEGADAVIHLAWLIQPSRDERVTRGVNVAGSERVFRAAAAAGVPRLVYASSIGAYSPGPKDRGVDESHPTGGTPTSFYSRHKAESERILDAVEREHPELAVVRLRPGLIFKGEAASEIRRYFAGPFLPNALLRRGLIPVVPAIARLRFQAVHSLDVGEAFALAAKEPVRGAFNIAAEPVLDTDRIAHLLGARQVRVPARLLRALTTATWRARLQPTPPGWLDMALQVPIMDTSSARNELGWEPRHTAEEAFLELFDGLRQGRGAETPPLRADTGGPFRVREFLTGIGGRTGA
jgi:nucleoside-diphosphate-sugar epimerase